MTTTINSVLAGIAVCDMARSRDWYTTFFGRLPDAEPMPVLAEWRSPQGTLQIVLDQGRAGSSLVTLQVPDAYAFARELAERDGPQINVDDTSSANVLLAPLTDPDGNAVTVVQVHNSVKL